MFCGAIVTGILQMLSLREAQQSEMKEIRYQRTPARSVVSEATVSDYLVKNVFRLMAEEPKLTINVIIHEKMGRRM